MNSGIIKFKYVHKNIVFYNNNKSIFQYTISLIYLLNKYDYY